MLLHDENIRKAYLDISEQDYSFSTYRWFSVSRVAKHLKINKFAHEG